VECEEVHVLNPREEQIWDEIERSYETEIATEPETEDVPGALIAGVSAVVVGLWVTIVLVLVGSLVAATVVGGATALIWVVLREWPRRHRAAPVPADRESADLRRPERTLR
jgi:hypothetical protein